MVISIIASIVIWGCIAVLLLRVIDFSGISLPENKAASILLENKCLTKTDAPSNKYNFIRVMVAALAFRIIVFCLSALAISFWKDGELTFEGFIHQYVQWDANNYQRITDLGYNGYVTENGDPTTLVFFPLYPWIARIVNIVTGNTYISLLTISTICYCIGCGFLYKLAETDYSKSTAINAVVFISVFPHGLFFGTMMNESLLFMNSVITLYFIRQHKWSLVGIFGALSALSRLAGILLAFPAAVEWLEHYKISEKLKNRQIKEVWKLFYSKGLWIFLMLLGIIIYLLCNYMTAGNCFSFLEYQERYWHHHSTYFGTGIGNVFKNAFNADNSMISAAIHIPSVISIIFVLAAMVYGLRRSRSMYSIYLIVYFIINMSVDWIISTPRYMACAVPAFIFLADFADRHKWSQQIITAPMAVGFGIYLTAYLFSKQIL